MYEIPYRNRKQVPSQVWTELANYITFCLNKSENRIWHFMQIGDNLHEMSNPVSGKNKKIIQNVVCRKLMFSTLWAIKQQTTYRDDTFFIFPENRICGISCKLSILETICMKYQIVFPGKNKITFQNVVCWKLMFSTLGKKNHHTIFWNIFIPALKKKDGYIVTPSSVCPSVQPHVRSFVSPSS